MLIQPTKAPHPTIPANGELALDLNTTLRAFAVPSSATTTEVPLSAPELSALLQQVLSQLGAVQAELSTLRSGGDGDAQKKASVIALLGGDVAQANTQSYSADYDKIVGALQLATNLLPANHPLTSYIRTESDRARLTWNSCRHHAFRDSVDTLKTARDTVVLVLKQEISPR